MSRVNQNAIRLIMNKKWKSNWYIKLDRNNFSNAMYSDLIIMMYILKLLFQKHWLCEEPVIKRYNNKLIIYLTIIYSSKKANFFQKKKKKRYIKKMLINKLKTICAPSIYYISKVGQLTINSKLIHKRRFYCHSFMIAMYIKQLINKRTRFNQLKKKLKNGFKPRKILTNVTGFKISISGRINGKFRARTQSYFFGSLKRSYINTGLRYTQMSALNIHGLYGIKVWMNVSEKSFRMKHINLK